MTANKAGEPNDYDVSTFKNLLKQAKQAFADGFDIGILPEGQLNPHPGKFYNWKLFVHVQKMTHTKLDNRKRVVALLSWSLHSRTDVQTSNSYDGIAWYTSTVADITRHRS